MTRKTLLIICALVQGFVLKAQPAFDALLATLYSHSVPTISADSMASALETKNPIILDTREKSEFEVSHLENAVWVGYDTFQKEAVSALDKTLPVVVYCSVGYRSEKIGEKLKELGFKDVRNLYGGIFEWKNQGYPVVNSRGQETDSVHTYNKLWSIWLTEGIKVYE